MIDLKIAALVAAILCGSALNAQELRPSGTANVVYASIAYSYSALWWPSSSPVSLNGLDTAVGAVGSHRIGVAFDLSYSRKSDIVGTGRHADVLAYMIGPTYYLTLNERFATFAEAAAGAARVTGVSHTPDGDAGGYVRRFAWAAGGGLELCISPSLSVRSTVSYLQITVVSPSLRSEPALRATLGLMYHFNQKKN